MLWLALLVTAAFLLDERRAIVIGVVLTAVAFAISLVVLSCVYVARRRQEKRFADGR